MMLERMDPDIAGLLMPKEEILLVASQSKVAPGGSISAPDKIYITTSRVLFKDPKMFGLRANIIAIKYEEIATVMLKRGVFSTEILLKPLASLQHIDLPAVDKQVALQVSAFIQKGMRGELSSRKTAQKQEPKPEMRLEPEKPKMDALDRLERLALMKHQGMITEEEFAILKEELMLGIRPQISGEMLVVSSAVQPSRQLKAEPPKQAATIQEVAEPKKKKKKRNGCVPLLLLCSRAPCVQVLPRLRQGPQGRNQRLEDVPCVRCSDNQ
ncbi:hypothetical protein NTE_01735 [Candidatus Nitrososphaera evergladensis SR1]|uniref:YokE-like PH domain-containing protein n=1 Tax=Candidatus Nitrososphaera evergladensis SR1 TaxID=1459636 RepID=A0A075MQI8_9ARCH|nr:PH domain-containing protein [Candidatus Nitrososphaera evergladensis]AIF83796.1 hypothetical protein NTE_01735 [Candidatus Nitrososphaera evergladensis SR1]